MVSDKALADVIAHTNYCGYWELNGQYFFKKDECLRYATAIRNNNIHFHFFDDEFNSVDWSTEPDESLEELYLQRALQLRGTYDYLMLAFSGGSDSTQILDTFLNNNIKIDEIVLYNAVELVDKLRPYFNGVDPAPQNVIFEYSEVVLPRIKKIAQTHPNIKITSIDYTRDVLHRIMKGDFINSISGGFHL